jgi:hypothetical protein
MTAAKVIDAVESVGGRIWLEGESCRYKIPRKVEHVLPELRAHREEVCRLLAEREVEPACRCGKWDFPHIHSQGDRKLAIREWNRDSKWFPKIRCKA